MHKQYLTSLVCSLPLHSAFVVDGNIVWNVYTVLSTILFTILLGLECIQTQYTTYIIWLYHEYEYTIQWKCYYLVGGRILSIKIRANFGI